MDELPCDNCKISSEAGHSYCTKCGRPVTPAPMTPAAPMTPEKKDDGLHMVLKFTGLIVLLACGAMLIFEMYALFWTFGDIWTGIERYNLGIVFLVPVPVVPFYIGGIIAKFYYLFLILAVIVSFVLIIYNSRGGIARIARGKLDELDRMPLYAVVTLFAAYISINVLLIFLVMAFGYDPATLEDPDEMWMLWYSLLNASVWEEVICRVLLIGVPLMIAGIAVNAKGSCKRLFGGVEMDKFAVSLIIFSAVVFSLGHLSGWDLFKVIPTFVCGLALGYLFVRFGLYAAIMLHFLIDFMSSVVWVFGSSAPGGMPTTAEVMLGLFILSVVVLGIPFIVRYAKHGFAAVKRLFS